MFEVYYVVDYTITLTAVNCYRQTITGDDIVFNGERFVAVDVKAHDIKDIDSAESEDERQELIDDSRYAWGIELIVSRLNNLVLNMEITPDSVKLLSNTDLRIYISPEDLKKVYDAIGRIDFD